MQLRIIIHNLCINEHILRRLEKQEEQKALTVFFFFLFLFKAQARSAFGLMLNGTDNRISRLSLTKVHLGQFVKDNSPRWAINSGGFRFRGGKEIYFVRSTIDRRLGQGLCILSFEYQIRQILRFLSYSRRKWLYCMFTLRKNVKSQDIILGYYYCHFQAEILIISAYLYDKYVNVVSYTFVFILLIIL